MALKDLFENMGKWGDSAGGFVDRLTNFDLGITQFAGGGQLQFFLTFAVYMAVFLFCFIAFYKFFIEYKIKVGLRYMIGGNIIDLKNDIAKEVVDKQGKRKLQFFWKRKLSVPIPELKYKYKMGKKEYYEFIVDDNDNLHPCEIAAEETIYDQAGKITKGYQTKIIPQERIAWSILEKRAIEDRMKKKGWLDKHKEFIISAALFATMILVCYFMFDYLKKGSFAIAQQLGQIATNCMRMGG